MKDATTFLEFWKLFATNMHANESSLSLQLSKLASFSFGRIQSQGLPETSRRSGRVRDYLVALQLKAIPSIEQFLGAKKVSHGAYPVGGVSVLRFADMPTIFTSQPFDTLGLYVSEDALDEIAHSLRGPRVDNLVWKFGQPDPVVHHLGQTLVASLEQPNSTSKLFLDHILHALNCHFVFSYGGLTPSSPARGGASLARRPRAPRSSCDCGHR